MTANDTVIILLAGAGATAWTDLWALVRRRMFGTPLPISGPWADGSRIWRAAVSPRLHRGGAAGSRGARHRLDHSLRIGVAFALLLPAFWGPDWIRHPTCYPR